MRPEIAACNAGTLNYLKIREDGRWAWPPMVFDNPVEKVKAILEVMAETGTHPEFECFDVGIVRSVACTSRRGCSAACLEAQLRHGRGLGHALRRRPVGTAAALLAPGAVWQATLIGRGEIWPVHQRVAELGGMLRTGLEDTFYLPDGGRASGNGALVEALADCARQAGREVATPAEARAMLHLAS